MIEIYMSPGSIVSLRQFKELDPDKTIWWGRLYSVTGPNHSVKLYSAGSITGPLQWHGPDRGWILTDIKEPCEIMLDGPTEQMWLNVYIIPVKDEPYYSTGGPAVGVYDPDGCR